MTVGIALNMFLHFVHTIKHILCMLNAIDGKPGHGWTRMSYCNYLGRETYKLGREARPNVVFRWWL